MTTNAPLLAQVIAAGQDFEWYPTTDGMIAVVARRLPQDFRSLMDIGAGDGRVLAALAKAKSPNADLFSIEKSHILMQAQPESVTPVGVDFHEQNLSTLPADFIFSNPPYSEFEVWAVRIIETAFAQKAYLVLPQRWKDCAAIELALVKRDAKARVIHSDTFENAERRARAVIDIIEVTFPTHDNRYGSPLVDPFDQWFDQNISTFDVEAPIAEDAAGVNLAKVRGLKTIAELVEAFNEDYARMEDNYRAIFKLDYAILKELGVSKDHVRDGIKKRMAGLKTQYWQLLFEKLDVITNRLSTATKKNFLDRLTGQQAVAFTNDNAFAVVMWAIKHANRYYDQQLVDLFRALSDPKCIQNYKSNQRTWQKSGWRYNAKDDQFSHYALDYRIVLERHSAIAQEDKWGFSRSWDFPGGLYKDCHELLDDMIAVFGNLGFVLDPHQTRSRNRIWRSNQWQDFEMADGTVLFQAKAFMNGNIHFRILPKAIKALNIETGRLLGWVHSAVEVEQELGIPADEARAMFGSNQQLTAGNVRLLIGGQVHA